jgi:hypothetical protein
VSSFFGLTLPDGVDARLRAGAPVLPLDGLPGVSGCEPGRQVKLIDLHGDLVACGIADPENGVIQVMALEAVRGFDAKFFAERLTRSLGLRRALGSRASNQPIGWSTPRATGCLDSRSTASASTPWSARPAGRSCPTRAFWPKRRWRRKPSHACLGR